jgi:hypothetical protein
MPPEVLLEDDPPAMAALAQGLRDIVLTAVPEALERVRPGWRVIGYDIPVGKRRLAYFAWVMTEPVHVHLGFPKGVQLFDPDGILQGEGEAKRARWFTLTTPDDLRNPHVAAFTRAAADAAELNSALRRRAGQLGSSSETSRRPGRGD